VGAGTLFARERGHEYSPFEARSPRRSVAGARILDGKGSHAVVTLLLPAARTHTKPGSAHFFTSSQASEENRRIRKKAENEPKKGSPCVGP
jgi:hypothetical protein